MRRATVEVAQDAVVDSRDLAILDDGMKRP
jgi:hypothetical protein